MPKSFLIESTFCKNLLNTVTLWNSKVSLIAFAVTAAFAFGFFMKGMLGLPRRKKNGMKDNKSLERKKEEMQMESKPLLLDLFLF